MGRLRKSCERTRAVQEGNTVPGLENDRLTPPFVASLFGSKRPLVEWEQPNAHEVLRMTVILLKPSDTASS